jgi:hypothetical protein
MIYLQQSSTAIRMLTESLARHCTFWVPGDWELRARSAVLPADEQRWIDSGHAALKMSRAGCPAHTTELITDKVASKESGRAIKVATSGIEIGTHGKGAVINTERRPKSRF